MKIEIETIFSQNDVVWTLHEGKFRQFKIVKIETSTETDSITYQKLEYFKENKYQKIISYKPEKVLFEDKTFYNINFIKIKIVYSLYPANHYRTTQIHLSEEIDLICASKEELIAKIEKISLDEQENYQKNKYA